MYKYESSGTAQRYRFGSSQFGRHGFSSNQDQQFEIRPQRTESLYVLYVVPRDELRYLWARDECNRLDKLKPEWRQQEKVTIRFEEVLTPTSLDQIYGRIQQEGR